MKSKIFKAIRTRLVRHTATLLAFGDWVLHNAFDWLKDAFAHLVGGKSSFMISAVSMLPVVVLIFVCVEVLAAVGEKGDQVGPRSVMLCGPIFYAA